ncbi:PREDICTED: pentatricopeptide repeat-containing protein At5g40410, mitochondrial-like isoform X3 [Lupinus angustifolius]|uniref:pentatricopeptide repeat-containing protein At5g40410, mitochondrial-like isoform X3 n=1 Tax=Lupinus angustifolius TaxID=3871 RepID=UPI00092E7A79|nr:PREDICTED: pentatricopeptide repeat-containing protein At5g40410, mitochondrial-like isoform X3 [Lupinus angustifolius]
MLRLFHAKFNGSTLLSHPSKPLLTFLFYPLFRSSPKCYSLVSETSLQFQPISSYHCDPLLSTLLVALKSSSSVSSCRVIHARVIKSLDYRDGFIGDQLVSCYINMGSNHDAEKLFDEMPTKDFVSWNSLVSGFSKRGHLGKCMSVFLMIKSELVFELNEVTVISVISACACAKASDEGQYIHCCAVKSGMMSEVKVINALINMYGKFGCIDSAFRLFWEMPERNVVSWNSMVAVCTQNGIPNEAINYFNMMRMNGLFPDEATMVSLLRAFENLPLGRLVEAIHGVIFTCGLNKNLTIVTTLLNLYSKLGKLIASHKVFTEISKPDKVAWTAMIAGYAMHGQGKEAIEFFERTVREGLWSDASKVRALMKAKNLNRNPGCSFIEHGNKIYRFVVDDYSHPDSDKINKKLEELMRKIQEAGFVSETESILHDVDEEVKTKMINKHSEKIALAYALLVTSADVPIVIVKNLRICRDCHNTAKFVSLIEKRVIIIRDSKRFHHFSDGLCSCGDYW